MKAPLYLIILLLVSAGCVTNDPGNPDDEPACKDKCGDGICQEIVCEAIGCPCPETAESCPDDCADPETSCIVDSDCGCGKKKGTDECFYGNKNYVDIEKQCPDFCSGISGKLTISCEQNRCVQKETSINSFEECVKAGYPVMESYPRQCRTPDGRSFTENVSGPVNMPNPASVYCEQNGGRLDIRSDPSGSQYGVCILPDGGECEEWAYFRSNGSDCQPVPEYTVAEVLDQACSVDDDCTTPEEYMMLSHCPYESRCLEDKCTVVCPKPFRISGNLGDRRR